MTRFIRRVTWLPLLLLGAATAQGQSPARLEPGRWAVGFTHVATADTSRPLPSGRPRPLDIGVWYPARTSGGPRLTYRRYFLLTPAPQDSLPAAESARRELDGFSDVLVAHGAPRASVSAWLDAAMLATGDAPLAGGRFPLVLVAQGNGQTLHDQAPLAEYLASYGYVVASVPSPMRIAGPLTGEREMGARAEEQAADLAFVLARMAGRPDVADGRMGVVGHSFGARAALLLAMQDPRIAALVSLDGGIGTATGRESLASQPSYAPSAVRGAILHLYERLDPFMAPDFALLRSLSSADRWLVEVPAMHHHHFASLGAVSVTEPGLRPALGASDRTASAYCAMAAAVRDFLAAFLKNDARARARLGSNAAWPPLGAPVHLARRSH